jgi:hypothetical protein
MIISSASAKPMPPGAPAPEATSEGVDPALVPLFALLLPEQSVPRSGSAFQMIEAIGEENTEETGEGELVAVEEAEPTQAEQIGLAALVQFLPPPPITLPNATSLTSAAKYPVTETPEAALAKTAGATTVDRSSSITPPDPTRDGMPESKLPELQRFSENAEDSAATEASHELDREWERIPATRRAVIPGVTAMEARQSDPADFAAPGKAPVIHREKPGAISSPTLVEVQTSEKLAPKPESAGNPDVSLAQRSLSLAKKTRGTAGAKPKRDMNAGCCCAGIARRRIRRVSRPGSEFCSDGCTGRKSKWRGDAFVSAFGCGCSTFAARHSTGSGFRFDRREINVTLHSPRGADAGLGSHSPARR